MALLSVSKEKLDLTCQERKPGGRSTQTEPVLYRLAAVGIFVAALFLRINALGAKSIWVDEASSIGIARLGWRDFFLILWNREANMAAYLLLLRFWLFFGDKEAFVRGLSVLFSVATLPIVYLLGKRLFGRASGLLGAWLLAMNAFHIRYAQETRSYAMVVFLVFLATLLLVRNLQESGDAHWAAYAGICVLAVYTHLFAGFFVLSHVAALSFLRKAKVDWPAIRRGFLWFALGVLPLGVYSLSRGTESVSWLPKMSLATVLSFLVSISGNSGLSLLALQGIALAVLAYGGWSIWHRKGFVEEDWGYVLIPVMFFLPLALTCGISLFKPFFLGRYLNPCVPAWCLLVGAGLARIRPVLLAVLIGAILAVFSVAGAVSYYRNDLDVTRGDWRSASAFIIDHGRPADDVFYLNFFGMPLEYYRSLRTPPATWPQSVTSRDGRLHYNDFLRLPIADRLRDARPAGNRVWLLLEVAHEPDTDPANQLLRAYFGKGRRLAEERKFDFISVELYERDAPP